MVKRDILSDKQYKLVAEYFANGFSKVEALRAAGYSETTATTNPQKIFDNPHVVREIERRKKLLFARTQLSAEWIITRIMKLADSGNTLAKFKKTQPEGTLCWDFSDATPEELALIQGLAVEFYTDDAGLVVKKFKIKDQDPLAALALLARIEGLFQDKLKVEADDEMIKALQAGRLRARLAVPEE